MSEGVGTDIQRVGQIKCVNPYVCARVYLLSHENLLCKMSPVHQAPPFCFPSVLWESESRLMSTDSSSLLGKLLLQVDRRAN